MVLDCDISDTAASDMDNTDGSEVEALLNEKSKGEKFDPQAKVEQMFEHNRRLRLCAGLFRKVDENSALEKENFRKEVESAEKNIELEMKNNNAEFNATLLELRKENASLQEKVVKGESDHEGGIVKVRALIAKLEECQESRRRALIELDHLIAKAKSLEETGSSQKKRECWSFSYLLRMKN